MQIGAGMAVRGCGRMELILEAPSAADYISLRLRSGMGEKDRARSRTALENSLFTASIYDGDVLVAFGRVVGDGGITYVVSDIMVDEACRRRGLADHIMRAIDRYLTLHTHADSYICLIANHPADCLYHKYRFSYLSDDKCGMLRDQSQ